MPRLIVSAAAQADLEAIQQHLRRESGTITAQRYADRFANALERLVRLPASGAPRRNLGPDTRIVVVMPYVIWYDYTVNDDAVVVVRVLHGRRHITLQLLRRPG